MKINAIDFLKENGYGQTEEGTADEVWKHILELKNINQNKDKIEKDYGRSWWENVYRDLNRATYFLCFD